MFYYIGTESSVRPLPATVWFGGRTAPLPAALHASSDVIFWVLDYISENVNLGHF
jgi:hypothetical protein